MQSSVIKKLIVPVIVFSSMLVLNVVNIIDGVEHHKMWKVIIASIATVLFIAALIMLLKRAKKLSEEEPVVNDL